MREEGICGESNRVKVNDCAYLWINWSYHIVLAQHLLLKKTDSFSTHNYKSYLTLQNYKYGVLLWLKRTLPF